MEEIDPAKADYKNISENEQIPNSRDPTLQCLRKLYHSDGEKLCRSKVFRFLRLHLKDSSAKVRYLSLEVLSSTVAKLGPQVDDFLYPVLHAVFRCLRGSEPQDLRCKALRVLRGYFCRTKNQSRFVECYIQMGIDSEDVGVRTACFAGLNVVFPLEIDNYLLENLLVALVCHMAVEDRSALMVAYRALRYAHDNLGDEAFFELLPPAEFESMVTYVKLYEYEDRDEFLTSAYDGVCDLIAAYREKIRKEGLYRVDKHFGMLAADVVDGAGEMADDLAAAGYLAAAVQQSRFAAEDFARHAMYALKLVQALVSDPDRRVQAHGLEILARLVERLGFALAPCAHALVHVLRPALVSANFRVKSAGERIAGALVRSVDPALMVRELLRTADPEEKEAALRITERRLGHCPHHEVDAIALCNLLGGSLEHESATVAKLSRTLVGRLLDHLRERPEFGDRSEALATLLQNYDLSEETLRDINAEDFVDVDDDQESDDEDEEDEGVEADSSESVGSPENSTIRASTPSQDDTMCPSPTNNQPPSSAEAESPYEVYQEEAEMNNEDIPCIELSAVKRDSNNLTYEVNAMVSEGSEFEETDEDHSRRRQKTRFCVKRLTRGGFAQDVQAGGEGSRINRLSSSDSDRAFEDARSCVAESYEENGIQIDVLRQDAFNFNIMTVEHVSPTDGVKEVDADISTSTSEVSQEGMVTSAASVVTAQDGRKQLKPWSVCHKAVNTSPSLLAQVRDERKATPCNRPSKETRFPKSRSEDPKSGTAGSDEAASVQVGNVSVPCGSGDDGELTGQIPETEDKSADEQELDADGQAEGDDIADNDRLIHSRLNRMKPDGRRAFMSDFESQKDAEDRSSRDVEHSSTLRNRMKTKSRNKQIDMNEEFERQHTDAKTDFQQQNCVLSNQNPRTPGTDDLACLSVKRNEVTTDNAFNSADQASSNQKLSGDHNINRAKAKPTKGTMTNDHQSFSCGRVYGCDRINDNASVPFSNRNGLNKNKSSFSQREETEEVDEESYSDEDIIEDIGTVHANEEYSKHPRANYERSKNAKHNGYNERSISPNATDRDQYHPEHPTLITGSIPNGRADSAPSSDREFTRKTPAHALPSQGMESPAADEGHSPLEDRDIIEDFPVAGFDWDDARDTPHSEVSLTESSRRQTYVVPKETGPASALQTFEEADLAFLPRGRQLARTPVDRKDEQSPSDDAKPPVFPPPREVYQPKASKKKKKVVKDKTKEEVETATNVPDQTQDDNQRKQTVRQPNSRSWKDCQWRTDLDYAAKATTCLWTIEFQKQIDNMEPLPPTVPPEVELKEALEKLNGNSWVIKEKAMLKIIQLAMHHQEVVQDSGSKVTVALSNEIKNFRQSVAGKAIFCIGHLYALMGKYLEDKLRIVIGTLVAKTGSRTLSAHYRLVVQSLSKVIAGSSATKAVMAFIQEGCKQSSKAARETAAQFVCILTENLGLENCMNPSTALYMLKCAAQFLQDCSHLNRYCAKRMFLVFMKHPDFKKMLNQNLDFKTIQSMEKTLEQLKTQGVKNELLPICLIEERLNDFFNRSKT